MGLRKGPYDVMRKRERTVYQEKHEYQDRRTPYEQGVDAGQGSGSSEEPETGPLRMLRFVLVHLCRSGSITWNIGLVTSVSPAHWEPGVSLCSVWVTGGNISDIGCLKLAGW